MTEHGKDVLAGFLFTAMLLGVLLGGWLILHFVVQP
jgi:hypothetical protein